MQQGIGYSLHKFRVGFRLRCPNCEQGSMFEGWFKMKAACSVCGAQFERKSGESVGGVMINTIAVELLSVTGFILVDILTDIPPLHQLVFWLPFAVVFPIVFYRPSRGLWVSGAYLNGDVRAGADTTPASPHDNSPPG